MKPLDPEWIFDQLFGDREDLALIAMNFYRECPDKNTKDWFLEFLVDVFNQGVIYVKDKVETLDHARYRSPEWGLRDAS